MVGGGQMKTTKIIATLGPSCRDDATLTQMIKAGVDIFRINTCHASKNEIIEWIKQVEDVSSKLNGSVPVLVDLQGPRVRTGPIKNKALIRLKAHDYVSIQMGEGSGYDGVIATPCESFYRMVQAGDPVLLDNGYIELKVLDVSHRAIKCEVIIGGNLGENKGINLPNAPLTLPALTPKDLVVLSAISKMKVDYVALSFVRNENDVLALQNQLTLDRLETKIIAKIEKPKAVQKLDAIMDHSAGIMVARGDLGIEMGIEKVPIVQKESIERARRRNIFTIIATQMLESMIWNARPTRAEVSDVANAVLDLTDAVMLSGETSIGRYPVETVQLMTKIILEAEQYLRHKNS
jgi:pyruvate kinase